jgi:hypothetical protein
LNLSQVQAVIVVAKVPINIGFKSFGVGVFFSHMVAKEDWPFGCFFLELEDCCIGWVAANECSW